MTSQSERPPTCGVGAHCPQPPFQRPGGGKSMAKSRGRGQYFLQDPDDLQVRGWEEMMSDTPIASRRKVLKAGTALAAMAGFGISTASAQTDREKELYAAAKKEG